MTKTPIPYTLLETKKLEKSRIEITGSLSAEFFESFRKKALANINNEITLDGFRKGKVPENVLVSKVGEMTVLEEMAELALAKTYPEIVINEKIDVIGRPEIQITKIAKDNPLEFKITSALVPELKLADYKKIAREEMSKKEEKVEVTEQELEQALVNLRKSYADHSGHDHAKMSHEEHEKAIEASMPALDENFIKQFGTFATIEEFKNRVKESILNEKQERAREKKRISISDQLIEQTSTEIPELLVDSETKRIEAQFSDDISRMGVSLDDYLKHAKKTIEDLRKDWRPSAEKKAKLQLILNKIASEEKIQIKPEEIENEVNHIVEHYKEADRERAAIYAETVLTNERVYQFLENQK